MAAYQVFAWRKVVVNQVAEIPMLTASSPEEARELAQKIADRDGLQWKDHDYEPELTEFTVVELVDHIPDLDEED
jgi:hypothetical protein